MISLLAPAKNSTVARAAIQAGADAIYIGAPKFGARQAAGNSIEDIATVVTEAHRYGVQVLVTLNTLLTAEEKKEAVQIAWQLYEAGVDALIVQDLSLLQEHMPPIRLHASTQCDNRTAEQVMRLRDLGFKRVVLARELSINEIRAIHEAVGDSVELEAFVHGALCVSYSGRCYLSEVLMNRSANRGCCAQMCRQQYDLLDAQMQEVIDDHGQPIHQRYLLSLQDMDRSLYLQELIEAGVTTFKIEGRLKDADYVTNIVAYYRQKLDAILSSLNSKQRASASKLSTRYTYTFTPNPEKTFHRGATDYFLHGRTRPMANWSTPKSTGERITDLRDLHPGDGLCFGDQGCLVNAIENGKIIPNKPIAIPKDTPLYRNYDSHFQRSLHAERRLPLDICFEEVPEGFRLTAHCALSTVNRHHASCIVHCQPLSLANNPERALHTIREQLSKLGDTIYYARQVEVHTAPYFIPISQLNLWRRTLLENL